MSRTAKALLLSTATILATGSALGQETLEDRIAALEAMVAELKTELAEERAQTDAEIVRLEEVTKAEPSDRPVATASGFVVGDTTFKLSGFVDLDAHVSNFSDGNVGSTSLARDFYIPSATPIGGAAVSATDFTAESSRFALTAEKMVGEEKVTGYIELDFLGSGQGNELVSNSYAPRLRRAYIDYNGFRIGQEWSTFQNTSAIPESASFLVLSDGMVFVRQAMIRYTNGNWQFAVENPNTTSLNFGSRDENLLPDVIARYNWSGEFGNVSFSGLVRQLRADFGGNDVDALGWGVSAAGLVKVGAKDDIRFNLTAGEGLGRYIGLAASRATALDPNGELDPIASYGGLIAWRHPFGDTARFNVGYSGLFIDNPDYLGGDATKSVQSGYAAVLWDVAPKVTLGFELLQGVRELENGSDGELTRFTFSTKYAF